MPRPVRRQVVGQRAPSWPSRPGVGASAERASFPPSSAAAGEVASRAPTHRPAPGRRLTTVSSDSRHTVSASRSHSRRSAARSRRACAIMPARHAAAPARSACTLHGLASSSRRAVRCACHASANPATGSSSATPASSLGTRGCRPRRPRRGARPPSKRTQQRQHRPDRVHPPPRRSTRPAHALRSTAARTRSRGTAGISALMRRTAPPRPFHRRCRGRDDAQQLLTAHDPDHALVVGDEGWDRRDAELFGLDAQTDHLLGIAVLLQGACAAPPRRARPRRRQSTTVSSVPMSRCCSK